MSARDFTTPPKFQINKGWLKELEGFHARVDATCRALGRFTPTEFKEKFGSIDPMEHGYKSLENLFAMRGCEDDGDFIYKGISRFNHSYDDQNDFYSPPKIHPNVSLDNMASYHSRVDFVMRRLKRFSLSAFKKAFGLCNFKHEAFGYYSVEHVLVFRGCYRSEHKYVFDEVAALKAKALTVASYFDGEFTEDDFHRVFRRFFTTGNLRLHNAGFHSLYDLLKSIRRITICVDDRNTARFTLRSSTAFECWKEQFEKILTVAKTLKNPFTENDLINTYEAQYCDVESVPWRINGRLVHFALEEIPGIEYVDGGKFCHKGGSAEGIEKNMEETSSKGREIQNVDVRRVVEKRLLTTDHDNIAFDDEGEPFKKARNDAPYLNNVLRIDEKTISMGKQTNSVVLRKSPSSLAKCPDTIQPGNYLAMGRNEEEHWGGEHGPRTSVNSRPVCQESTIVDAIKVNEFVVKKEVLPDEEGSVPSPESPSISTNPSETDIQPSLYHHILNSGVVRGHWAEQQLSGILQQGAIEGVADLVAAPGCSSAQSFEAAGSQEVHQALSELMGRYHNEFLNAVILGAMERGVDPKELGKKFLDLLFDKTP